MEQTKEQNQNSAPEEQSWQAVEPSVFKPVNALRSQKRRQIQSLGVELICAGRNETQASEHGEPDAKIVRLMAHALSLKNWNRIKSDAKPVEST